MSQYPAHLFDEPEPDVHTLRNLGPLTRLAGTWEGTRGLDIKPEADGPAKQAYVERIDLQPIDPQTNGPQLLYGLRYHTHIVKPDDVETYHDQVGYWLWEPATGTVFHSLTIPRAQTALAMGQATADADSFELVARRGSTVNGICSGPFLEQSFRTDEFRIRVQFHDDGTWSYDQTTVLVIGGQAQPFDHRDRNRLHKVADPLPNPLARADGA